MNIDFTSVINALKEINYTGDLTLEADAYLPKYYNNPENIFEGIQNMADSAKRLAGMF
jgi:sugar phosphate isomerase/epimerase